MHAGEGRREMIGRPPQNPAPPEAGASVGRRTRLVWACLPAVPILSAAVLLLLGASWQWTLLVLLLVACPAAVALAVYLGFQGFPSAASGSRDSGSGPERGSGREASGWTHRSEYVAPVDAPADALCAYLDDHRNSPVTWRKARG